MRPDDLDVAGFAVGVVERGHELGAHRVKKGDALVGFRLARPALERLQPRAQSAWSRPRTCWAHRPTRVRRASLGEELLVPSVIYAPAVMAIAKALGTGLHAAAHITGGGIMGNVVRILPAIL